MKRQHFSVSEFVNRSGSVAYRVSGYDVQGARVRENYADQLEAEAAADAYELARVNAEAGWRTIATRSTDAQLEDADRAREILRPLGKTLTAAAEFMRDRWRPAEAERSTSDARDAYLAQRAIEEANGELSRRQLRALRLELRRFVQRHPGRVGDLTQAEVLEYVSAGGVKNKTRLNRRGYLAPWFAFCRRHKWTTLNPFADVPQRRGKRSRGLAPILSPEAAEAVMRWAEKEHGARAVTYFALCLFAGIRPDWRDGEISKLTPAHVHLDRSVIVIPPEVSKINEVREITIRPNLADWLKRYPLDKYPPIFRNYRKILPPARKTLSLAHDVLRHSFCTYVLEQTGSLDRTAAESGNSVAMIRAHYRGRLVDRTWLEKFWAIKPNGAGPS
jgi:integrase